MKNEIKLPWQATISRTARQRSEKEESGGISFEASRDVQTHGACTGKKSAEHLEVRCSHRIEMSSTVRVLVRLSNDATVRPMEGEGAFRAAPCTCSDRNGFQLSADEFIRLLGNRDDLTKIFQIESFGVQALTR